MGIFQKLFTNATPPVQPAAPVRGYQPLSHLTTGTSQAPNLQQQYNQLQGMVTNQHPAQNYQQAINQQALQNQGMQNNLYGVTMQRSHQSFGTAMAGTRSWTTSSAWPQPSNIATPAPYLVAENMLLALLTHVSPDQTGEAIMLEPINVPGSFLTRVPICVTDNNHYAVFVGRGLKRIYDQNTLPDIIKSKLAIINTSKEALRPEYREDLPENSFRIQVLLYTSKFPKDFEEIGWRVSNTFYCIVMPQEALIPLQSGTLFTHPAGEFDHFYAVTRAMESLGDKT